MMRLRHGNSANFFGQDKKMGVGDFDDDLHTPVGFDDKVQTYKEF